MQRAQIVRCPNCGSEAQRQLITDEYKGQRHCLANQISRTECPVCDYLMVMRSLDGSVIEAYAPGINSSFKPSTTSETDLYMNDKHLSVITDSDLFSSIFPKIRNHHSTDSYSLL